MNIFRYKYAIVASLAVAAWSVTACDEDDDDSNILFGQKTETTVVTDSTQTSTISTNSYTKRLEVPALKEGNQFYYHTSIEGKDTVMTFCFEYDFSKFHSRWIAFRFDEVTRPKVVSRKNNDSEVLYQHDELLPTQYMIDDDESFDGYDHGHLCASADRLYSRTANDNTFYMTNMSPQIGSFNQQYWTSYESYVQTKGRDASFADTLYVVKGGTIDSDENIIKYVCKGRMAMPKYYYMALLKVKNNTYSAMAFLMEHKTYDGAPTTAQMAEKIVTIDYLEEFTGIDFFHNLPDVIENVVEASVAPTAWGF